jgi:nucleotide-binding universal stress UspA family protein
MYKTIFTYFSTAQTAGLLAETSVQLARKHGAHLVGAHNSSRISLYGGIPSNILAQHNHNERITAEAIEQAFTRAAAAGAISHEWRHQIVPDTEIFDDIIAQAHAADLIIACGNDDADTQAAHVNVPVRLSMETGRPVLLLPAAGGFAPIGERVALAWSNTRESARATFDALPMLTAAASATVLCVQSSADGPAQPGGRIAAVLARHGMKAEVTLLTAGGKPDWEELLGAVTAGGYDLLVMGCYGHSRLRQMVLGGVTRHVLSHLSLPVLISH